MLIGITLLIIGYVLIVAGFAYSVHHVDYSNGNNLYNHLLKFFNSQEKIKNEDSFMKLICGWLFAFLGINVLIFGVALVGINLN